MVDALGRKWIKGCADFISKPLLAFYEKNMTTSAVFDQDQKNKIIKKKYSKFGKFWKLLKILENC